MTHKDLLADSILAASAITKNRFVGFDGAHCAAGKKALGVSKNDYEAGEMAAVEVYGIQVLEAGGIFAAGDPITSDSTGRAVKAADFAVASTPTVGVSSVLDIDVDTALDIDASTSVTTTVATTVSPTVTVAVPSGETPVLSSAAQPTLTINASATAESTGTSTATTTATGTATNTASGTAVNTVTASVANSLSGGALPVAINGYAKEASSGAGQFARVVLK